MKICSCYFLLLKEKFKTLGYKFECFYFNGFAYSENKYKKLAAC
jgi:hypothetical protein